MRLLGLFEFLKANFNCVFFIKLPTIKLKEIIESYCKTVVLKSETLTNELFELDALLCIDDIVVLDGYNFNEDYQQHLKTKVHKLVMIDDKAAMHFYADLIINHGTASSIYKYKRESYTKILGGIDYLIIRKEFLKAASSERKIDKIDSVFICMGGADPFNGTIKSVKAAINCGFIQKIIVITGNAFTNMAELEDIIAEEGTKRKEIIYETNVNATRLIELMNMCQLAICPSSSVALEVCCVKAGLLTGIVVDNQVNIHKQLIDLNCCITLHNFNNVTIEDITIKLNLMNDSKLVNDIMQNQLNAIDGKSDERLCLEFKLLSSC